MKIPRIIRKEGAYYKLNKIELPVSIRNRYMLHSVVYADLMQYFRGKKFTIKEVNERAYLLLKSYFDEEEEND
jgi:hypothetical protein